MRHSFIREIFVFVFFVVAAVLMTWPLAAHLDSAISDPGDPYVSMAILDWDLYATLHHPSRLFHQPVFYPSPYALAFTEHLYGMALPVLPFYLAGVPLIALYNISVLLGFALCGYGAYVVGRLLTGSAIAGLGGGLFFAFVPYRITQMPHISYVWAGWLPLLLAALLLYDQKPTRKRAAFFGFVFFMNGLTTLHWLAMGAFAAFVGAVFLWLVRRHDRAWILRLGLAVGVAIIFLLPFLLPYGTVRDMYNMKRSSDEAQMYSAQWRDWFIAEPYLPYGSLLSDGSVNAERWLFPGFVPLLLGMAGFLLKPETRNQKPETAPPSFSSSWLLASGFRRRLLDAAIVVTAVWSVFELAAKSSWANQVGSSVLLRVGSSPLAPMLCLLLILWRFSPRLLEAVRRSRLSPPVWVAILWLVLGVIGALGLNNFFYSFLFDYVRLFRSIRVPARWAMVAYIGLAALISCGIAALSRGTPRRSRFVPLLACALLILEISPAPRRWYLSNSPTPPVYQWLARTPIRGPILEMPVAQDGSEYGYMRYATLHRKPMIGGVSSFIPPQFERLAWMAQSDPIPDGFIKRLEEIGTSLIIVHADNLGRLDRSTREWLQKEIRAGRLTFVRRFPHDHRGDYVFALTATEPRAAFWREPEQADPSGRTPLGNLQAFLDHNAPTYFDTTLGALEPLTPSYDALGELNVSGWAASPHGIREVNLRFHNGARVIAADRFPRPDITTQTFPWYPKTTLAGFRKSFPNRPDWAREDGELQVEIIDGSGKRKLLDPVFFTWRDRDDFRLRDWNRDAMRELIYRIHRRRDSPEVRRANKTGLTMDEIVHAVVERNRKKDDRAFIDKAFHVLLNRPADEAGMAAYLIELRRGASRREVVRALVRSPEFRRLYFGR